MGSSPLYAWTTEHYGLQKQRDLCLKDSSEKMMEKMMDKKLEEVEFVYIPDSRFPCNYDD